MMKKKEYILPQVKEVSVKLCTLLTDSFKLENNVGFVNGGGGDGTGNSEPQSLNGEFTEE